MTGQVFCYTDLRPNAASLSVVATSTRWLLSFVVERQLVLGTYYCLLQLRLLGKVRFRVQRQVCYLQTDLSRTCHRQLAARLVLSRLM